ncbi:MAG: hypothetical protein ACKKL6_03410 [Candidatus Komeilibacteria bacterium]
MNSKVIMTILFFGLLFFVINLSPVEAAWSDPSCAPPGCNRPEPITVEGGTIQEGHTLTVQGDGVDTFDTSISSGSGLVVGSKIDVNPSATYATQDIFQISPTCYGNMDNCWGTYSSETTYFDKIIVASSGIALEEGQTISMPGNNGIYINGGLEGSYGFAVYARAADLNHSSLTGYDSGATQVKNSAAIWGVTTDKNVSSDPYSSDVCTTSTGAEFDETNLCAYSYGGFFQGFTSRGVALHTRSYAGAYGAYLRGTILVGNGSNFVTTHNVYNDVIPWYTYSGTHERYPEFIVKTANTFWNNPGYNGTPSTYEEYEVLKVESSDPKKVQIGGAGTDYEICLNDSCITEWSSGGGSGGQAFKFIDVDSGDDPQADSSADRLYINDGANISVVGGSNDSITISMDLSPDDISQINGASGNYLYLNGDNSYGVKVYDKLTVDGDIQISSGDRIRFVNDQWAIGKDFKSDTGAWYVTGEALQLTGYEAATKGVQILSRQGGQVRFEVEFADGDTGIHGNLRVAGDVDFDQDANVDGTIVADELCIGKVCINESQLQELLFLIK